MNAPANISALKGLTTPETAVKASVNIGPAIQTKGI